MLVSKQFQKSLDFFYLYDPRDVYLLRKSKDQFAIGKKFFLLAMNGEKIPVDYLGDLHETSNLSAFRDQEGKVRVGVRFQLPEWYPKRIPVHTTTEDHITPKAYEVHYNPQFPRQETDHWNDELRSRFVYWELLDKSKGRELPHPDPSTINDTNHN